MKYRITVLLVVAYLQGFCQNQGFCVKGQVLDSTTNKPLAGVILHLSGYRHKHFYRVTDSNGNYVFDSSCVKTNTSYKLEILSYGSHYGSYLSNESLRSFSTEGFTRHRFNFNSKVRIYENLIRECRSYMPRINFGLGVSELSRTQKDSLKEMEQYLVEWPGVVVEFDGHSSQNEGSSEQKEKLSMERAMSCRNYFISEGIDSARLEVKGWSDKKTLIDTKTIRKMQSQHEKDSAYAINRRVVYRNMRFDYPLSTK